MTRSLLACIAAVLMGAGVAVSVQAQQPTFAPPPRSISDVIAILDQQKPNSEVLASRQRIAAEDPSAGASKPELAKFYYDRALARSALGRTREAIADGEKAMEYAERPSRFLGILRQFVINQYVQNFEPKKSLALLLAQAKASENLSLNAQLNTKAAIVRNYIALGDLLAADAALKETDVLLAERKSKASAEDVDLYAGAWEAAVENARGRYLEARGLWKEAQTSLVKAELGYRDALAKRPRWPEGPAPALIQQNLIAVIAWLGDAKRAEGRLAEAEVDVRRALLLQLSGTGKYHPSVARLCLALGGVMRDQGRWADYERLSRTSLEILRQVGFAEDSDSLASSYGSLANSLRLQERWAEAGDAFASLDRVVANWEPGRRTAAFSNPGRVFTLYNTGQIEAGIDAATKAVAIQKARVGTNNFDYGIAEGNLGIGLGLAGRDDAALEAFRVAAPILLSPSGEDDDTEGTMSGARQRQADRIIAAYVGLMARQPWANDRARLASETFVFSDALRGHSVAGAVAASSSRSASQDPALADLARREQDLRKQLGADFGLLNNALSLPPAERDEKAINDLREEVTRLRGDHAKVQREIGVRFPEYADLIDPKPANLDQVRAALRPGEAFVSYYLGSTQSFVWAVTKTGPADFAVIPATAREIEAKVRKLREALEPNAASVSDIPAFDVALAHELYTLFLKPVEATWRPARSLVVATNGAFGALPLGVLPTAPSALATDKGAAFTAYRTIPWLARTHAVSLVPSAAAFRTLRGLPAGGSGREPLIGFGDPLFSSEQASDAAKQAAPLPAPGSTPLERRSAPKVEGLASATLASLPRLPDTADELVSVAGALRADKAKVLMLGKAANEENVRKADLSKYRVVAFATHGLMAGELDGLTQPALALSAPEVSGVSGDGLLTLEKILSLKLDADWVVLSACNTGAGGGAGAEAASGLGRAFFYAGTRAILVTNWSVHSQSARDLVSNLFGRQAADPKLTRAEALRQAELALMDGPGLVDAGGHTMFTYAHPLFWAPYTIIGDGS